LVVVVGVVAGVVVGVVVVGVVVVAGVVVVGFDENFVNRTSIASPGGGGKASPCL
jgi:ABC-type lipoprotein release transport system permease subunit